MVSGSINTYCLFLGAVYIAVMRKQIIESFAEDQRWKALSDKYGVNTIL